MATFAVAAAALLLPACSHPHHIPPEQLAAQAYLTALGGGQATTAATQTTPDPAAAGTAITASLTGLGAGVHGTLTVTGLTDRKSRSATANYDASWTLPGVGAPWKYSGTLPMVKPGKDWLVQWSAADINPQLPSGAHLTVRRSQPARAQLLDDQGHPLLAPTPVVHVGINPSEVVDLSGLAASLAAVPQLKTTAAEIVAAVKASPKNQFVEIITLRRPAYEQIRARIHELKGTAFPTDTLLLPPSSGFARPLLGSVGDATKELIDGSRGRLAAGDQTGLSGLERALDPQLAGVPSVSVYAVTAAASGSDSETLGAKLATVQPAVPGKAVRLTLNSADQRAADAVLASEPLPAAIVVSQPSTGKLLAVANSSAADGDIALTGQYPAGSTFKIATYTAAFEHNPSLTADSQVACPKTVTVDGRVFENENKFEHGQIPVSAAFGFSCNTTAISTAVALPGGMMFAAAQQLGLGAKWNLPVDAFSGSMPATATGTEKAAEAIGQGKVLVSPALMAEIVSAAATGKPITPSLLADRPGTAGKALDPAVTAKLNSLLRATVAMPGGTANASLGNLPGAIRGKTGTAEFGTDVPPKSHSWFAGVRGDLAISVFIYGGEQSSTGAVVLAQHFFTAVP